MNELNFNEEIKPKKSKLPFIFITIVIIVVIATSSFVVYKKVFDSKNVDNQQKATENKKEDNNVKKDESEIKEKEYVIDATYKRDVVSSYQVRGTTIYLKDLVFPYLNVDTKVSKSINKEIEKVYDEYIELYEQYSKIGEDIISSKYSYTITDNIVSILIEVNYAAGGGNPATSFYTFNYDIKEDKKITLNDLSIKYNIDMDSINKQVNEKISTSITDTFDITNPEEELPDIQEYIKKNKVTYELSIKNNNTLVYIDKENKLNVLVLIEHPYGGSYFYYETLTITK